jgi:DNA-binding NtrC family response regulator
VWQPHLYLVLDGAHPGRGTERFALTGVRRVSIGRGSSRRVERVQVDRGWELRILLEDARVSRDHAVLSRSEGRWELEDRGSRNGTFIGRERLDGNAPLADRAPFGVGRAVFMLAPGAVRPRQPHISTEALEPVLPGVRTFSAALERELETVAKLVRSAESAILVRGPSGSGKEVLARAIHEASRLRGRAGPFVGVNCAALPSTLLEAELFGARRGAYSGATEDREGLVRAADLGTLFLDEIADLPLEAQAALLRVLEEREVRPVGSTQAVPVDIVLVSATHQDVEQLIEEETFRHDLYARIATHEAHLPPLADRLEDLGLLVATLLEGASSVTFAGDAAMALATHDWPLNVRELAGALRHARVLSEGGEIDLEHLPKPIRQPTAPRAESPTHTGDDAALRSQLAAALTEHGGNISAVARALGQHRRQIQRWLRRLDLDPRAFKR